jgi:hypothetical protein
MSTYEIVVKRNSTSGTLTFSSGLVSVSTTCWWDPKVVIEGNAEGYLAYATRMNKKKDSVNKKEKRPGIWLGKGVKYSYGTKKSNEIFIHEGKNANWSDGCIVILRDEMIKMWNSIHPKDTANVRVKVIDVSANRPLQAM